MNGICPCGGVVTESVHELHTLAGAIKWFSELTLSDLPAVVLVSKCASCGRLDKELKPKQP
jgi:hypothetical protein